MSQIFHERNSGSPPPPKSTWNYYCVSKGKWFRMWLIVSWQLMVRLAVDELLNKHGGELKCFPINSREICWFCFSDNSSPSDLNPERHLWSLWSLLCNVNCFMERETRTTDARTSSRATSSFNKPTNENVHIRIAITSTQLVDERDNAAWCIPGELHGP